MKSIGLVCCVACLGSASGCLTIGGLANRPNVEHVEEWVPAQPEAREHEIQVTSNPPGAEVIWNGCGSSATRRNRLRMTRFGSSTLPSYVGYADVCLR